MSQLSLDEYRLMMGTQLWIKESIFNFIETLLGNVDGNVNDSNSNNLDDSLRKVTEELNSKSTNKKRKSKVSKIDEDKADTELKKDLSELRDKFEEMQKQQNTGNVEKKVNLSDWTMFVNDNSAKRDQKQDSLISKLRHYKSNGYIK
jgi:hypothetical protein